MTEDPKRYLKKKNCGMQDRQRAFPPFEKYCYRLTATGLLEGRVKIRPPLTFLTVTDEALRQQIDMAELVLERRAALRSNGERIREVVRLKELQHHFISYRSKV